MNRLRGNIVARFLASVLTLSLGVVVVSPAAHATGSNPDYGEWLLLHIPGAQEPAVKEAAHLASLAGAKSFDEYLTAFQRELESLTSPFGAADLPTDSPDEQLYQELRFEYTRFVGEAMLPRWIATSVKSLLTIQLSHSDAGSHSVEHGPVRALLPTEWNDAGEGFGGLSSLLRESSAQPLGP